MDIGHRMKELRIQYGLTQQELADRSELSKGFISQLERGLTTPSIGTLLDIIQCLGTTPAEFFTDDEPEQIVFSPEDYFEKNYKKRSCRIEWLIPNAQKNAMEPVLLTLAPGGKSETLAPKESEEFGYVLLLRKNITWKLIRKKQRLSGSAPRPAFSLLFILEAAWYLILSFWRPYKWKKN